MRKRCTKAVQETARTIDTSSGHIDGWERTRRAIQSRPHDWAVLQKFADAAANPDFEMTTEEAAEINSALTALRAAGAQVDPQFVESLAGLASADADDEPDEQEVHSPGSGCDSLPGPMRIIAGGAAIDVDGAGEEQASQIAAVLAEKFPGQDFQIRV